MCEIKTLSGNTILIECESQTVELSTDDKIQLSEDFYDFNRGDILSVDPWINSDKEYELYVWNNNIGKRML